MSRNCRTSLDGPGDAVGSIEVVIDLECTFEFPCMIEPTEELKTRILAWLHDYMKNVALQGVSQITLIAAKDQFGEELGWPKERAN